MEQQPLRAGHRPARPLPRELTARSTDRSADSITIDFARIPGDDLYCGTAARFDFRFSTADPIATQAEFDAATPVASVPPPPPGNHDAGGSITVSDARFADQLVHLAVQVVDDVGNVSPVTSLGSFSLLRSFTLVRGRVTFRRAPGGGDDGLSLRGVVPLPLSAFDPSSEAFTLMLSDDDGTIFNATIPAGQFLANSRGTRLLYHVRTPGLSRRALVGPQRRPSRPGPRARPRSQRGEPAPDHDRPRLRAEPVRVDERVPVDRHEAQVP